MSFNIRYGTADDRKNHWIYRFPLAINLIKTHSCDVVGLQEPHRFQIDEITKELPEYSAIGAGRDDGAKKGEYAAILYNNVKFELIDTATFWFSETPHIAGSCDWGSCLPRVCTWALLKNKSLDFFFYHFNLHLDHKSHLSRKKSCELLINTISSRMNTDAPVIVTGDFNTTERNEVVKFLKGTNTSKGRVKNSFPLIDTYKAMHPVSWSGTFHLFSGFRYGPRIDYIFTDQKTKILSSDIIRTNFNKRYPSDHFPLIARLQLQ